MATLESIMSGLKNGESRDKLWQDLAELRLMKARYCSKCGGRVRWAMICAKDGELTRDETHTSNPNAKVEIKR